MSVISPLRVLEALLRSFVDISQPLLKCFANGYSCLFRFAIPRMSCFRFRMTSLFLTAQSFHTIALDELEVMDDSRNGETKTTQSGLENLA